MAETTETPNLEAQCEAYRQQLFETMEAWGRDEADWKQKTAAANELAVDAMLKVKKLEAQCAELEAAFEACMRGD